MSIVTELKYTANLDKGVCMTPITPSFMGGDQEAHRITVDCYRQNSREAVDLSGAGVTAYFVRADGMTIPLVGETNGSKASVLLPAACYAVMGRFSLVIKLSLDDGTADSISTVFWGEGAVSRSRTDVVIDPDSVIPSLEELLAQIAAMEIATSNANTAAGNANQAAADALKNVDEAVARQDEVISQLSEEITADLLTKAPAIECEASGSIVTVTDAAAQPAVQLVTHIEPVQEGEGDPSPDNVRPISGWDAVNLRHGASLIGNSDIVIGTIMAGGGLDGSNSKRARTNYIYCQPGAYAAVTRAQMYAAAIHCYSGESADTWTGRIDPIIRHASGYAESLFTLTEACYVRAVFIPYDDSISAVTAEMIAAASPMIMPIQTLTADLPETVYGGTVDWGTGVLTVDRARYVCTGAENWVKSDIQSPIYQGQIRYDLVLQDMPFAVEEIVASDSYPSMGSNKPGTWTNSSSKKLELRVLWEYATVDELKAYFAERYNAGNPVTMVYRCSPYTIQLTPQQLDMLKATNNVWSDTGDTSLVYVADTKLYIDGKFAELNAAILSMGSNV